MHPWWWCVSGSRSRSSQLFVGAGARRTHAAHKRSSTSLWTVVSIRGLYWGSVLHARCSCSSCERGELPCGWTLPFRALQLCPALHRTSQAPHHPKHRGWRCCWRHPTPGWSGCSNRPHRPRWMVAVRACDGVDSSPFLGTCIAST